MTTRRKQAEGTTRREFLRDAGLLGVTLAGGGILAACGSAEVVSETPPAQPAPEPSSTPSVAAPDVLTAEIAAKKVKLATAEVNGRTVLFIAGKVEDPQMLQMVCESFNGQVAF